MLFSPIQSYQTLWLATSFLAYSLHFIAIQLSHVSLFFILSGYIPSSDLTTTLLVVLEHPSIFLAAIICGGGGRWSCFACLRHLTVDHSPLSRRSTVATPNDRDASNSSSAHYVISLCCMNTFLLTLIILFRFRLLWPPNLYLLGSVDIWVGVRESPG